VTLLRGVAGAAVFLGLLFFALDNADPVTVRLFRVATWNAPLVFVAFVAFALGAAVGLLTGVARASRLKRQLKRARREHGRAVAEPAPHGAAPSAIHPAPPPDVV